MEQEIRENIVLRENKKFEKEFIEKSESFYDIDDEKIDFLLLLKDFKKATEAEIRLLEEKIESLHLAILKKKHCNNISTIKEMRYFETDHSN